MTPRVSEIVRQVDAVLSKPDTTRAELLELVCLLAAWHSLGLVRLVELPAAVVARNLTPAEAAQVLGVTVRWMYEHAHGLECTRRPSPGKLRFDSVGLERLRDSRR